MELIGITVGECTRALRITRRRSIYFPDLIQKLNSRYGFMEYPTTLADMNTATGISFRHGKFTSSTKRGKRIQKRDVTIQTLGIQDAGFMASGPDDTQYIEEFLDDLMLLLTTEYKYEFQPILPPRYLSRVNFLSDKQLLPYSDYARLAELINQQSELRDADYANFIITGIQLHVSGEDASVLRPYAFNITRAQDEKQTVPTYTSDAPLRTRSHIDLLKAYEKACQSDQ